MFTRNGLNNVECRDLCRVETLCRWFTLKNEECTLFENCATISASSCPTCLSGQEACTSDLSPPERNSLVFVIGGYQEPTDDYLDSVEAFEMTDSELRCDEVKPYPIAAYGILSAFLDNRIIACGGKAPNTADNHCYEYDNILNDWFELPPLPASGYDASSSSVIDGKWLISGGVSSSVTRSTFIYENGEFTDGPPLPVSMFGHCQVTINDTHVFFCGGRTVYTFIMDLEKEESYIFDNPPNGMYVPACGLVNSPTFGKEIIMADYNYGYIFSLETETWRDGIPLPTNLNFLTNAQFEKDFATFGGRNTDVESTNYIYKFDADLYEWKEFGKELQVARDFSSAIAAPKGYITCN